MEQYEELALLIDRLSNLSEGLSIPIQPSVHVDCLKELLPALVAKFKAEYIKISGDNPWE